MLKLKHWRASQTENAPDTAPVLVCPRQSAACVKPDSLFIQTKSTRKTRQDPRCDPALHHSAVTCAGRAGRDAISRCGGYVHDWLELSLYASLGSDLGLGAATDFWRTFNINVQPCLARLKRDRSQFSFRRRFEATPVTQ